MKLFLVVQVKRLGFFVPNHVPEPANGGKIQRAILHVVGDSLVWDLQTAFLSEFIQTQDFVFLAIDRDFGL